MHILSVGLLFLSWQSYSRFLAAYAELSGRAYSWASWDRACFLRAAQKVELGSAYALYRQDFWQCYTEKYEEEDVEVLGLSQRGLFAHLVQRMKADDMLAEDVDRALRNNEEMYSS